MKHLLGAWVALAALAVCSSPGHAESILFVGNSFTFGEHSAAKHYRAGEVHDLNPPDANGQTIGGVPAIFKEFTKEAGLDYDVSLETVGGKGLDFHYEQKRALLDRAWDVVMLQSYSTLNAQKPGDPALVIDYAGKFDHLFHARNPAVKIYLDATWSRPDLTYPDKGPWHGKPIEQMAEDVQAGYVAARTANPGIAGIVPVGLGFNRAIADGVADPDPYDGIAAGKVDLWAYDHYHASAFGYYLEALLMFGEVTGRDPQSLGPKEIVADDFGFSPEQATTLQRVAHEELAVTK
jgi:hypothetical protein